MKAQNAILASTSTTTYMFQKSLMKSLTFVLRFR
jgi:hypothetical protein